MNKLKERMSSDKAATNTVEIIVIIALAVFAALALFTFILKPVQQNSADLGKGIDKGVQGILKSNGTGTPSFDGSGQGNVGGE